MIRKWKEAMACRAKVKSMLLVTLCNECMVKKQKCFLPELARERRLPSGKRK